MTHAPVAPRSISYVNRTFDFNRRPRTNPTLNRTPVRIANPTQHLLRNQTHTMNAVATPNWFGWSTSKTVNLNEIMHSFLLISDCGHTFTGMRGILSSPNYPSNYGNDADCGFLIQGGSGQVVSLTFGDFELEQHTGCDYDSLDVRS